MRKCKCGNDVSRNAKFCPKCGHQFKVSGGVTLLAFVIVGLMIWGFMKAAGVGSDPTSAAAAPDEPPSVA
jgi:hypothetical protein